MIVLLALLWPAGAWAQAENDPFEPVNRAVWQFNDVVDGLVLEPASELYGVAVPSPMKRGVRNFLDNLRSPVVLANDILQGERERAGITFSRFFVNTIMGVGGIFDVAEAFGFSRHGEDFGQTLAVWGLPDGPYLVLPLFGPSSTRDAGGMVVDSFVFDPVGYVAPIEARIARQATDAVDQRWRFDAAIDDLRNNSFDPYATARSVYLQQRASQVRNGMSQTAGEEYEDIFDDDFSDPAAAQ